MKINLLRFYINPFLKNAINFYKSRSGFSKGEMYTENRLCSNTLNIKKLLINAKLVV